MNRTDSGAFPETGEAEKLAVSGMSCARTRTFCSNGFDHPFDPLTLSVTLYSPGVEKVWTGFWMLYAL